MLPKNLSYKGKIESASCRSYKSNIAPQNASVFQLGETIIFNIPTRNNLCLSTLDSYIKFTVPSFTSGTSNSSFRWGGGGANGLIQRIRVWSGSNLLEDITEYGLLASMMNDIQVPTDSIYGKQTILSGTRNDLCVQLPARTAAAASTSNTYTDLTLNSIVNTAFTNLDAACLSCNQVNSGESFRDTVTPFGTQVASGKFTQQNTYCLNLISILGSLCSAQYFPLFACKSSAIRLEITLNSTLNQCGMVLGSFTTPNGIIKNCEFICQMLELSDSAMGTISQSLQGQPLQFVVNSFKNYPYTTSAMTSGSASSVSMAIPAKVSSLRAIYLAQRDNGSAGATGYFPHSSVTFGLTDYNIRIGSEIFPPKSPATSTEMFAELLKSIDSIGNVNHQPSIEKVSYNLASSVITTTAQEANNSGSVGAGSFYVGFDCESYTSANKDQIFAGLSTLNSDIYFQGNYTAAASASIRLDSFCMYDSLIVFENDVAYAKN